MQYKVKTVKLSAIKLNPDNPRQIDKHKMELLKKSIEEFPEMTKLREIVVDEDMMILGGNMRYHAMQDLGMKDCEVKIAEGLTPRQKLEFIIKDNSSFGEWDLDMLANSWDEIPLADWGVDMPQDISEIIKKNINGEIEFTEELREAHNYIVLYFDNEVDWQVACKEFDIKSKASLLSGESKRIGIGRIINGTTILKRLI